MLVVISKHIKNNCCFLFVNFLCLFVFACNTNKKLITDEVFLKNNNSITGTIVSSDSTKLKIIKFDESSQIINWNEIDTIVGKKYKSLFFGLGLGLYNTPYFSVFKNEAINSNSLGFQIKIGRVIRLRKLNYFHFTQTAAKPFAVSKLGFGLQRYFKKFDYVNKSGFYYGSEFNALFAKYNNGFQTTLEPYLGYELILNNQILANLKFQLQINVANRNNNLGVGLTLGFHFLKTNFKQHYDILNSLHVLKKQ
jgi:hypothetical protein